MENSENLNDYLTILNQVFEIEKKISKLNQTNSIVRNIERIKNCFANGSIIKNQSLVYQNPLGEKYTETRTDCEASIAGNSTNNLKIVEVLKPIIRLNNGRHTQIVQKGIVIVESDELK